MSDLQSRVDQLKTFHNEAATKLDYFILGATLAICAYLAQTNPYGRVGLNEETFLLITLVIFACSATCGFKRIEATIRDVRRNAIALSQSDRQVQKLFLTQLERDRTAHRWYRLRNFLLALGLGCYLTTKVWAAYQSTGWIPVP